MREVLCTFGFLEQAEKKRRNFRILNAKEDIFTFLVPKRHLLLDT